MCLPECDQIKHIRVPLEEKDSFGNCIYAGLGVIPTVTEREYHTRFLVTKDSLRVCTAVENACNKLNRRKPKIYKRKLVFCDKGVVLSDSVVEKLKQRGYTIQGAGSTLGGEPMYNVISPELNSTGELEQEMEIYEDLKYGAFKYKLEEDFTDSIDLLIRHYILDELTKEAMIELNAVRMNKQQDFFKEQK